MAAIKYPAGDRTRDKIFQAAVKLFFEKGFVATTYDDIAKEAEVNRALLIYHFENKKKLGLLVWERFNTNYYEAINEVLESHAKEEPERFVAVSMFAFYRLFRYENLTRFLMEIQSESNFRENLISSERDFFMKIKGRRIEMDESTFHILMHMDYGIEREVVRMAYFHKKPEEIDKMAEIEFCMIMGELGYSYREVEKMVKETKEILGQYTIALKDNFQVECIRKAVD